MTLPSLPQRHLDQYFGLWAMHPEHFQASVAHVRSMDLHLHVDAFDVQAARESVKGAYSYDLTDGIATIRLAGATTKYYSSFSGGMSTILLRQTMRAARRNPEVQAAILVIDSPGGAVSGNRDWVEAIRAFAAEKPLIAYIEDLGASAAYWAASAARKVYSNDMAIVGSIGTYGVVYDYSQMAEMEGIKAHVIRAGELKGMGTPGTEITEEQLDHYQRVVNELNEFFIAGVMQGRNMTREQVKSIATGEVWIGQAAAGAGLTDGVRTFSEVRAELLQQVAKATTKRGSSMSTETKPQAATAVEIEAACTGAGSDFVLEQLKAGSTLSEAKDAWIIQQGLELEAAKKERDEAKAKKPTTGVEGVTAADAAGSPVVASNATQEYRDEVKQAMARGMTRAKASKHVLKRNPELREAYAAEASAGRETYDDIRKQRLSR